MKVTIFNLLPVQEPGVKAVEQTYIDDLNLDLSTDEIEVFDVDATKVKDCIGCWSCWIKTPGQCVFSDAMPQVYSRLMDSDVVLFMLPTRQGFIEGHAKTFIDRLIPLYHPYIFIHGGEMMHQDRYKKYPQFEFYYDQKGLNDKEDQVLEDYIFRTSYHFRQGGTRLIKVSQEQDTLWVRKKLEPRRPLPDTNTEIPTQTTSTPKKYFVYNGSPRGKKGNSLKIAKQIILGIEQAGIEPQNIELRHLVEQNHHKEWALGINDTKDQAMDEVHYHLFVFPLYVHSMPGIVKKYFDLIEPLSQGSQASKQMQISFFVQSGFSGAYQSQFLRAYLARLPQRLNCKYGGTLIKGGMEALQVQPDEANRKLYSQLQHMGKTYVVEGKIGSSTLETLGSAPFISNFHKAIYLILKPTGLMNLYWNMQLKNNGAFNKRFDRPYEE